MAGRSFVVLHCSNKIAGSPEEATAYAKQLMGIGLPTEELTPKQKYLLQFTRPGLLEAGSPEQKFVMLLEEEADVKLVREYLAAMLDPTCPPAPLVVSEEWLDVMEGHLQECGIVLDYDNGEEVAYATESNDGSVNDPDDSVDLSKESSFTHVSLVESGSDRVHSASTRESQRNMSISSYWATLTLGSNGLPVNPGTAEHDDCVPCPYHARLRCGRGDACDLCHHRDHQRRKRR